MDAVSDPAEHAGSPARAGLGAAPEMAGPRMRALRAATIAAIMQANWPPSAELR